MLECNAYETVSGCIIYPWHPNPVLINIRDIAHALSNICRFGGHCSSFYSVAQHSVLVSQVVSPENALMGLMHDATEAYLSDVVRPLKKGLPEYSKLEGQWEKAIFSAFGITGDHAEIKEADNHILSLEIKAFVRSKGEGWPDFSSKRMESPTIVPWTPDVAREKFMQRWLELQ